MWIGIDRGIEKVTVNYKKDKKDGLATAYYNDGVIFTVNYKNGVGEDYDRESFKNYKTRNKLKFKYILPNVVVRSCD